MQQQQPNNYGKGVLDLRTNPKDYKWRETNSRHKDYP